MTASEAAGCGFNSRHAHHSPASVPDRLFMKTVLPWVCVAALLAGVYFLYSAGKQKDAQIAQLQTQLQELDQLRNENEQLKKSPGQDAELERLRKDNEDLLRLRNEVGQLREQNKQLTTQLANAQNQRGQALQQQQQLSQLAAENATLKTQSQQAQATAQANACIAILRQIDAAKKQWAQDHSKPVGSIPGAADLAPYFPNGTAPTCPLGGTYNFGPVGLPPTCSVQGHVLPR